MKHAVPEARSVSRCETKARRFGVLEFLQIAALLVLPLPAVAETIASGENRDGAISVSGEADLWTFTASAGDRIVIRIAETGANTTFYPRLQLFAPADALLDSSAGSRVAEVVATATVSGTYSVAVDDVSASGKATGTYRLRLARMPGAFVVADDGGELVSGQNHDGTMDLGDLDPWSFSSAEGDRIVLRIGETGANTTFYPQIRLYAPDGSLVEGKAGGVAAEVTAIAAVAGTYTVLLSDDSTGLGGTGTYRLQFARMPGAFVIGDEGGGLVNGQNHDGTIDVGDLDPWSFPSAAGDRVVLRIAETGANTSFVPQIRLYAPDGVLLDTRAGSVEGELTATVAASGTCTVLVGDDSTTLGGTGTYRLRLAKIPGAFVVGDEGGHVGTDDPYEGTVTLGDLDLWTFAATAGDSIVVRMDKLSGDSGFDPQIRLYAPDGVLLDSDAGTMSAEIGATVAVTGLHTVLVADGNVTGSLVGTGTYELTVSGNVACTSDTICRAAVGECDVAEQCVEYACPSDVLLSAGTPCTADASPCTADVCSGSSALCQHPAGNAGAVCRASSGACDVAETCTGTTKTCPADGFAASLSVCRPAQGECDAPESCTGVSVSCPADDELPAGTPCIDDGNPCTNDLCSGASPACQHAANSAPCSDGVFCNGADTCSGGACTVHTGNPCSGPDGDGNCGESCTEGTDSCTGADPDGSPCNDGDACTSGDTCTAGGCAGEPEPDCSATTTTLSGILCGDANGDGEVTAADALHALRVAVGIGSCPLAACDYSGDGEITAADALAILRAAVGQDVPANCPEASTAAPTTIPAESTTTTMP